jgi:aldose 1-epimerase
MRPVSAAAIASNDVLAMSSFVLVPYSNRIANGTYPYQGKTFTVPSNFPGPHPLHAHGWQRPWTVTHSDANSAELSFSYSGSDYPQPYSSKQIFKLDDTSLSVTLTLTNLGDGPMPAGLGQHPYFPRTADVRLNANLTHAWLSDDYCIPHTHAPMPSEWSFNGGRRVEGVPLDCCFSGWDGIATIDWPSINQRLEITAWGKGCEVNQLVIFVPPGQDYFCVEPVTNANDAFNMYARGVQQTGVVEVQPGQTIQCVVKFTVSEIPQAVE